MTTYSTSNISFVYCFSKTLAVNEEQYEVNLEVLSKSVEHLKGLHQCKIFTDTQTYDDLKELSDNIEIVNTDNFKFLDDFKIKVLQNLTSNEILIDPDVMVFEKLKFDTSVDLIFDRKDSPSHDWYLNDIEKIKGTKLYDKIKLVKNIPFVPNIAFFKINNTNLLREYTDLYNFFKEDLLSKLKIQFPSFSILLGQYLLGIVLYEGKYSYIDIRGSNKKNSYVHLGGPQKYKKLKPKTVI